MQENTKENQQKFLEALKKKGIIIEPVKELIKKDTYNKQAQSKYNQAEKGKLRWKKHQAKRKQHYDYNIIRENLLDEAVECHHINVNDVVFLPKDLHQLYSGVNKQEHRFMCNQIVKQIYDIDIPDWDEPKRCKNPKCSKIFYPSWKEHRAEYCEICHIIFREKEKTRKHEEKCERERIGNPKYDVELLRILKKKREQEDLKYKNLSDLPKSKNKAYQKLVNADD
jgi:hypothetical protein